MTTENNDVEGEIFLGVDLGYSNTVIGSSRISNPSIVSIENNELANSSTPSTLGFKKRLRLVGEVAEAEFLSNPSGTIQNLVSLFSIQSQKDLDTLQERTRYKWRHKTVLSKLGSINNKDNTDNTTICSVMVKYDEKLKEITPEHLLAIYLDQLCGYILSQIYKNEIDETEGVNSDIFNKIIMVLAIPNSLNPVKDRFLHAASIAGIKNVSTYNQSDCLHQEWMKKNLPIWYDNAIKYIENTENIQGISEENRRNVKEKENTEKAEEKNEEKTEEKTSKAIYASILDVGAFITTMQIIKMYKKGEKLIGSVVCEVCNDKLGSLDFTNNLVDYIRENNKVLKNDINFDHKSKRSYRLFQATEKLVKDLSGLPQSTIELDCYKDDEDLSHTITRDTFENVCKENKKTLEILINECLNQAKNIDKEFQYVYSVDFSGGGSRIPWVQKTISSILSEQTYYPTNSLSTDRIDQMNDQKSNIYSTIHEQIVRRTLDTTSAAACGAVIYAANLNYHTKELPSSAKLHPNFIPSKIIMEEEKEMRMIEKCESARLEKMNDLETKILQTRSIVDDPKNRSLIDDYERVDQIIQQADDWFMDAGEDSFQITYEEFEAIEEKLTRDLAEPLEKYYKKVHDEKVKNDAELAKNAVDGALTREDDSEVTLPPAQLIKKATKNKDEGTELYKGGNIELAARRYAKALEFTMKLRDSSEEFKKEGDIIAYSCNLNLAQCYLKMKSPIGDRKSVATCDSALKIEPKSAKALYRKAVALERLKEFEEAKKAIDECVTVEEATPEVIALRDRMEAHVKQQNEKSKQMYSKMFG